MSQEQAPQAAESGAGAGMARGWSLNTFRQGVEAAKAGAPASTNPYREGSDQAVIWHGGWLVGVSM